MMPDWLQETVDFPVAALTWQLIRRLLMASILGCVAAGVHYYCTSLSGRRTDRSFSTTLVLLSLLIALVTQVIGNNLALAFSLVGTLSIVRFRTVVEDTRDTAFVIFAVVAGMAAGYDYSIGPIVATPLVLLAVWFFAPRRNNFRTKDGEVVIRLAAGKIPDSSLEDVLKRHFSRFYLRSVSTARGGAAIDVTYGVAATDPRALFPFLAEMGKVEGIQSIEFQDKD